MDAEELVIALRQAPVHGSAGLERRVALLDSGRRRRPASPRLERQWAAVTRRRTPGSWWMPGHPGAGGAWVWESGQLAPRDWELRWDSRRRMVVRRVLAVVLPGGSTIAGLDFRCCRGTSMCIDAVVAIIITCFGIVFMMGFDAFEYQEMGLDYRWLSGTVGQTPYTGGRYYLGPAWWRSLLPTTTCVILIRGWRATRLEAHQGPGAYRRPLQ